MTVARKTGTVTFRMDEATQALIRHAAELSGKSVTAFVTEAASAAAERELLDRRFIGLDAEVFDRVVEMLDAPARPAPRLVGLLGARPDRVD